MIAIPFPMVIERDDKQVGAFEMVESIACGGRIARQRGARRSGHALEDGCFQQEGAHLLTLTLEHFLYQVVRDVTVIPAERFEKALGVTSLQ